MPDAAGCIPKKRPGRNVPHTKRGRGCINADPKTRARQGHNERSRYKKDRGGSSVRKKAAPGGAALK